MSTLDDLASKLGEDVMKVMDETGDDRFFMEVAQTIGAASQTLEEAFLTDVRVRLAERKGRALIAQKMKAHRTEQKAAKRPEGAPPPATGA